MTGTTDLGPQDRTPPRLPVWSYRTQRNVGLLEDGHRANGAVFGTFASDSAHPPGLTVSALELKRE